MPLILITGTPGSGKSTVLARLQELGYIAYGTDEHGLSQWIDRKTGKIAVPPKGFDLHEWYVRHEWKINPREIQRLKERADADGATIFVAGVGDGIEEAWPYFDKVIVLVADTRVLKQRVATRTGSNFGKVPAELKIILEWQDTHVPLYTSRGAHSIDTTDQTVDETVRQILGRLTQAQAIDLYKEFLQTVLEHEDWYGNVAPHIKATLLYGSTAKGTNRADSDIDILLIVPLGIEEQYTSGEYFYGFSGHEINIVLRSVERLRDIAAKGTDQFQSEVFRDAIIITQADDEVQTLLQQISKI